MMTISRRAWSRGAATASLLWLGSVGGCGPATAPASSPGGAGAGTIVEPRPAEPPPRPLNVRAPASPSKEYDGDDISKADPRALASAADRLANRGDHRAAAQLQFWAVRGGRGGTYNLACWTAMAGDVEGAFHWLQESALGDGVDASWAEQDPDLESLRKDPRWKQVVPFLKKCNAFWAASGHKETVLVVPSGYKPGTPIAVVVGMHGMGARPDSFIDPETYQPLADDLGMAFVGVSGTIATGRHAFVWSEDPRADAAQIRRALAELAPRLTPRAGHLIALGFSQGAQLGFEVAFQNPADYRGAIVISPGTSHRFFRLGKLAPDSANKGQGYVCLCGAGEAPGNVGFTQADADFARKAGARVDLRLAPGQTTHAFPADFTEELPAYLRFIDGTAEKP